MSSADRPLAPEPTNPQLRDQVRALDLAMLSLDRHRMRTDNNIELILGLQPLVGRGFIDIDCLPARMRYLFQSWIATILETHKGQPVEKIRTALKSAFFTAYFVSRLYEYEQLPEPTGDMTHAERPDPRVASPDDRATPGDAA